MFSFVEDGCRDFARSPSSVEARCRDIGRSLSSVEAGCRDIERSPSAVEARYPSSQINTIRFGWKKAD